MTEFGSFRPLLYLLHVEMSFNANKRSLKMKLRIDGLVSDYRLPVIPNTFSFLRDTINYFQAQGKDVKKRF